MGSHRPRKVTDRMMKVLRSMSLRAKWSRFRSATAHHRRVRVALCGRRDGGGIWGGGRRTADLSTSHATAISTLSSRCDQASMRIDAVEVGSTPRRRKLEVLGGAASEAVALRLP